MITLEIIQRVWTLIPPPAPDGSIEVRELETSDDEITTVRLTIDQAGQRHLLIPAASDRKLVEDKRSSGVYLLSSEWQDENTRTRYVDLVCLKPHLNGLFDVIIYEVLSEIHQAAEQADRVCLTVLNRWRELLAHDTLPMPERSAVIGLFGELTVLRRLVQVNPLALSAWTGPDGGRFDFFAGGHSLEVKTTLRRQGILLTIHGHDQLDTPQNGSLHLVVLLIEETPSDGENLNILVDALALLGVNRVEIYRKLAKIGFIPDTLAMLDNQRFRVVEQRVYEVNAAFPRITAASFVSGELPRGVVALSYTIDLSVPPPHALLESNAAAIVAVLAESVS